MLGKIARDFVENITPIRAFAVEQEGKLAAETAGMGFRADYGEALSSSLLQYKKAGRSALADWWGGHNLERVGEAIQGIPEKNFSSKAVGESIEALVGNPEYAQARMRQMYYRRIAVGALAAGTVGQAFMGDNIVSDAGSTMTSAAIGFVPAGLLTKSGSPGARALGWGIASYSAFNMVRPGDNWGPF